MKRIALLLSVFLIISCKKNEDTNSEIIPPESVEQNISFVETDPPFPLANKKVTLYFDLGKGSKGLMNTQQSVYIFTGILTPESNSSGDWKNIKYDWSKTPPLDTRLEKVEDNLYRISFIPSDYYNSPSNLIKSLVFVLRNGDGSMEGKNSDKSDIVIPVYSENDFKVKILTPDLEPRPIQEKFFVKELGYKVKLKVFSSQSSDLKLIVNNENHLSKQGSELNCEYTLAEPGIYNIEAIASKDGVSVRDTLIYMVEGVPEVKELPTGLTNGASIYQGKLHFMLTAPEKKSVYLLGDFNDFKPSASYSMNKTPDGKYWWIALDINPKVDYTYQYLVDGTIRIADPYSELILDPENDKYIDTETFPNLPKYPFAKTTGILCRTQLNEPIYNWKQKEFNRPNKENLFIYELLLRDFLALNNYSTLKDTINYFKELGVNCIELMPISEFEGNLSWGYNPSFYFAPDKYYGTKNELKAFIDACHEARIAVVVDMVLNHSFGQSPMVQMYWDTKTNRPSDNNPWFNPTAKHPYNVGYDMNHESSYTKEFVKDILEFWSREYKVDGFRFDLSKGFTQLNTGENVDAWGKRDEGRITIWKEYNQFIKDINSDPYVILEHFAEDSEEVELASEGMMLWNNLNYPFYQLAEGRTADISRLLNSSRKSSIPAWVSYMESHDEERLMYKALNYGISSGDYNCKNLTTALKRVEMSAAFLCFSPGPNMLWQFGEFGYDISIDYNGRLGSKPLKWDYLNSKERQQLKYNFAKLIRLKTQSTITNTQDIEYDLKSNVKYIKLISNGNIGLVIGNFGLKEETVNLPIEAGRWYNYITGQSIDLVESSMLLKPGEYYVFTQTSIH